MNSLSFPAKAALLRRLLALLRSSIHHKLSPPSSSSSTSSSTSIKINYETVSDFVFGFLYHPQTFAGASYDPSNPINSKKTPSPSNYVIQQKEDVEAICFLILEEAKLGKRDPIALLDHRMIPFWYILSES